MSLWRQEQSGHRKPASTTPAPRAAEAGRDSRELVCWAFCHLSVSVSEGSCWLWVLDGMEESRLEAAFACRKLQASKDGEKKIGRRAQLSTEEKREQGKAGALEGRETA